MKPPDAGFPTEKQRKMLLAYTKKQIQYNHVRFVDPDDVVQAAFEVYFKRHAEFELIAQHRRLGFVRRTIEYLLLRPKHLALEGGSHRVESLRTGADEQVATLLRTELLHRVLATIDPAERHLLEGYHVRGESIRNIANAQGRSEDAVRQAICRARGRARTSCKSALEEQIFDDWGSTRRHRAGDDDSVQAG